MPDGAQHFETPSVQTEKVGVAFLDHHGIKGMKWGIRNKERSGRPASGDSKKASELRKKPLSSLTNNQLQTLNTRMNLEQNYKRMNPKFHQVGKKRAEEILGTIGIGVTAYSIYHSPAGKAAIAAGIKLLHR